MCIPFTIPTLIADTKFVIGISFIVFALYNLYIASATATNAPVIDAVLVPPSAWITSQSTQIVLSPNLFKSTTDLIALPINLCISCVLPSIFPLDASLIFLCCVALGSIEYSAFIHPVPLFLKKGGTFSSTDAVHITFVSPISIRTEPSAYFV